MNSVHLCNILPLIICPQCQNNLFTFDDITESLNCNSCGARYPVLQGRPVLLRSDNLLFSIEDYSSVVSYSNRSSIKKFIPSPSVNLSRERTLKYLKSLFIEMPFVVVLVVGCGQQRLLIDDKLGSDERTQVVYIDIDVSADVDVFCDAHELPFADHTFDCIITTAVLQHVIYPEKAVSEICRVIKPAGFIYSEMAFIQQVIEGAYDFTRYSLSGHRRLLNNFSEIESGIVAGPATALLWSIENFALSFVSNHLTRQLIKVFVRLMFFWIKYFDYLFIHSPQALDGASCTYFLGKKSHEKVADSEIIRKYTGAKHLRHV